VGWFFACGSEAALFLALYIDLPIEGIAHMALLSRRDSTAERWTLRSIRRLAASRISEASMLRRRSRFTAAPHSLGKTFYSHAVNELD
jgi:hypothetical protein